MARLSFHVFNDDADVDTALNVLEAEARPPPKARSGGLVDETDGAG
jgi:hypothetical protein